MPTFLPVSALSRSTDIRIAGQLIKQNLTSYIDLGVADSVSTPTFATSTTAVASSLVKSKYYNYAVTAVVGGGETTPTNATVEKAGAGAEGASEFNTIEPKWGAVAHATAYRVYRSPVVGDSSSAKASANTLTLIAEVASTVLAYNDLGVANGTATPPKVNGGHYNVGGGGWSTRKELQNHSAIGQLLVLGPPTQSNLDYVPYDTPAGFALTLESEQYKVTKTKLVQRSTGVVVAETNELTASSFKSAGTTKITVGIAFYNPATNLIEEVKKEATVAPPSVALFKEVAALVPSYAQVLYVLSAKEKVVTNVTATYITDVGTPRPGDTTNAPVIATA